LEIKPVYNSKLIQGNATKNVNLNSPPIQFLSRYKQITHKTTGSTQGQL